jgi:hypothetical protein
MRKKTTPPSADEPLIVTTRDGYEDTGFCSYCLLSLEAKQPGGHDVRHKATLTPYGNCPQAIRARETKKA